MIVRPKSKDLGCCRAASKRALSSNETEVLRLRRHEPSPSAQDDVDATNESCQPAESITPARGLVRKKRIRENCPRSSGRGCSIRVPPMYAHSRRLPNIGGTPMLRPRDEPL